MRHVASVRKRLRIRTIFNLLGPLCNPACVHRQLMGVYAAEWVEPLAHVLADLGSEHAWVVHGSDGLDELTTTGPTNVAMLRDGEIARREVVPDEIGVSRSTLDDLRGGDARHNAAAIRNLLSGEDQGPFRNIVLLNAAAALVISGKTDELGEGAQLAAEAIDTGKALRVLRNLVEASQIAT
jgi:anthranilate phosphoribosyltransferase